MPMVIASLTARPAVEVTRPVVRAAVIPDPTLEAGVNGSTKAQVAVEATAQLRTT
jgi:hypothetical protein